MDAIETERLTKSYGATRGIVDVDLAVPVGSVFGFLGPNGAGKTTTIRVLLDLLRPTRGSARVLGLDSHADAVEIHRRVGYVPGDPALYERVTARELLIWLGRLRGGVARRTIETLAERFGLELDRHIRALSRGNRQKVALVQAFMHEPELLILDEPTAGLDPLMQHEFGRLLREVSSNGGTVFLSSHLLDEVQEVCDHISLIREGRLVAIETMAALQARAVRRVTIRFGSPVEEAAFAGLTGVTDVRVHDRTLECDLTGTADSLIKVAAQHEVVDFTSEPADLEDLFLRFYEREEVDDGTARRATSAA